MIPGKGQNIKDTTKEKNFYRNKIADKYKLSILSKFRITPQEG